MASEINPPEIEEYVEAHTTPPADFMRALAQETREKLSSPTMLTGTVEGRFLETLAFVTGARRVLEIGTYSGYSALSFAAGMGEDGRVITCELDPERATFARRHMDNSPYADRIEIRVGPALETMRRLEGEFDIVFIDADKTGYPAYFEAALTLLSARGLIVLDNVLWSGRVLDGAGDDSEDTRTLAALNDRIAGDDRVVAVMLPVRDGVTLVRRAS